MTIEEMSEKEKQSVELYEKSRIRSMGGEAYFSMKAQGIDFDGLSSNYVLGLSHGVAKRGGSISKGGSSIQGPRRMVPARRDGVQDGGRDCGGDSEGDSCSTSDSEYMHPRVKSSGKRRLSGISSKSHIVGVMGSCEEAVSVSKALGSSSSSGSSSGSGSGTTPNVLQSKAVKINSSNQNTDLNNTDYESR